MNIRSTGIVTLLLAVVALFSGAALAEDALQANISVLKDGQALARQDMTFRIGEPVQMLFQTGGESYRLMLQARGKGNTHDLKLDFFRAQGDDWVALIEPTIKAHAGQPFKVDMRGSDQATYTVEGTLAKVGWADAQRADKELVSRKSETPDD